MNYYISQNLNSAQIKFPRWCSHSRPRLFTFRRCGHIGLGGVRSRPRGLWLGCDTLVPAAFSPAHRSPGDLARRGVVRVLVCLCPRTTGSWQVLVEVEAPRPCHPAPPPGVPMGTTDTGPARPISEGSPVAFPRQEESAKPRVHQRVDSHPLLRRVGCGACSRRKKVFQGHEETWPSTVPSQRRSTSSGLCPGL